MEHLTLRNGSTAPAPIVHTTMMALRGMMSDLLGVTALYDLHQICLGGNYKPSTRQLEYLKSRALLQPNGRPYDSIRNVVLSAIDGEGLDMTIVNPVVPSQG